jgi:hypothetical protein
MSKASKKKIVFDHNLDQFLENDKLNLFREPDEKETSMLSPISKKVDDFTMESQLQNDQKPLFND